MIGKDNEIIGDVPSMDRPEFFAWRKKAINIMMKKQGALYLSGPSDKMIDFIIRRQGDTGVSLNFIPYLYNTVMIDPEKIK